VNTNCNTLGAGISVLDGGTANIHDNTIADVRHEPPDSCGEGNGIVAGSGPAGTATVTIVHNTIARYQKNGITVRGADSTATISDNTVTGAGPTTMLAQNGIQVSGGAFATVTGNTVSGHQCDVPAMRPRSATQGEAGGIALFPAAAGPPWWATPSPATTSASLSPRRDDAHGQH
jgi:hypothetical protein